MDFLRTAPRNAPSSALKAPPPRRISTPAGERLSTILETGARAHTVPNRSRWSGSSAGSRTSPMSTLPRASAEPMPPPYAKFGNGFHAFARERPVGGPVEGEKVYALRTTNFGSRRGGWGRILALLALVLVIVIALAVGLGVGLTRHKSSNGTSTSPEMTTSELSFPLGEYSMITALASVATNCTSNPSTWRCFPYSTYSSSDPTSSMATFNWILSNTSSAYVSNSTTLTTTSQGIPANISVSSTSDPFTITVTNETLTYINDNSDPRYTFNFTMSKTVVPTTALTSDNSASECFFNQTQFIATLYLSASGNSPSQDLFGSNSTATTATGGYTPWPYALQIQQVSDGGTDVPACYKTVDGAVGERITGVFTAEAATDQCVCDYTNFGL